MAGEGSRLRQGYGGQARLRGSDKTLLKPFVRLLGRPLISYTLENLMSAGIKTVHFVVGYESERMISQAEQLIRSAILASFLDTRAVRKLTRILLLPPP